MLKELLESIRDLASVTDASLHERDHEAYLVTRSPGGGTSVITMPPKKVARRKIVTTDLVSFGSLLDRLAQDHARWAPEHAYVAISDSGATAFGGVGLDQSESEAVVYAPPRGERLAAWSTVFDRFADQRTWIRILRRAKSDFCVAVDKDEEREELLVKSLLQTFQQLQVEHGGTWKSEVGIHGDVQLSASESKIQIKGKLPGEVYLRLAPFEDDILRYETFRYECLVEAEVTKDGVRVALCPQNSVAAGLHAQQAIADRLFKIMDHDIPLVLGKESAPVAIEGLPDTIDYTEGDLAEVREIAGG